MEIRIQELDQLFENEREANRLNDERCADLTAFLTQHRKLKHSWKSTVQDINEKYLACCQSNDSLTTENKRLRSKLSRMPQDLQYGDGHNIIVVTTADVS